MFDAKEYQRKYYQENRSKLIDKNTASNRLRCERNRNFIIEYKSANPCPCGESDPCCLEFHHKTAKFENVSHMVRKGFALEKIATEIKKCQVLCGNCHAKLHCCRRKLS